MKLDFFIRAGVLVLAIYAYDCPGATEKEDCKCAGDAMCYIDLDGKEGKRMCCDKLALFCSATGMRSFHSKSGNAYKHKWDPSMSDKFYEDPVTKALCPLPHSYHTLLSSKDLPVGFSTTSSTPLKTCTEKSQCGSNEYCGFAVDHPSNENPINVDGKRFCYQIPNKNNVSVQIASYAVGLKWCANHKACKSSPCLKSIKIREDNGSEGDKMCATALVCPNPDGKTTSEGALTAKGEFCKTNADCAVHATYTSDKFEATCTPINGDSQQKVCCYQAKKEEPKMCPDGATPLSGEPMCTGSNEDDEYSGKCTYNSNGMCYRGHCCPTAKKIDKQVVIGATSYTTNVKCNENEMVPSPFVFARCREGRVVVLGRDEISKPLESYQKCSKSSPCSGSATCVSTGDDSLCIPDTPVVSNSDEKARQDWTLVEGILIGCGGVLLGVALGFAVYKFRCKNPKNEKNNKKKKKKTGKNKKSSALVSVQVVNELEPPNQQANVVNDADEVTARDVDNQEANGEIVPFVQNQQVNVVNVPLPQNQQVNPPQQARIFEIVVEPRGPPVGSAKPEKTKKQMRKVLFELMGYDVKDGIYTLRGYQGLIPFNPNWIKKKGDYALYSTFPTEAEKKEGETNVLKLWVALNIGKSIVTLEMRKNVQDKWLLILSTPFESKWADTVPLLVEIYSQCNIPGLGVHFRRPATSPSFCALRHDLTMDRGDPLGQGQFGAVYKGVYRCEVVALKIVNTRREDSKASRDLEIATLMMIDEVLLSYPLNHRNVVKTYGIVADCIPVIAIMEYCPGGSLLDHLEKYGDEMTIGEKLCYILECASGLRFLHGQGIIHRDVAARNFLISRLGIIKIADFGLSRKLNGSKYININIKGANVPIRWMAPESIKSPYPFGKPSDVFGLGTTFYEVITNGQKLWPEADSQEIFTNLKEGNMPFDAFPINVRPMMKDVWTINPEKRITIETFCVEIERILKTETVPPAANFTVNKVAGVERITEIQDLTERVPNDTTEKSRTTQDESVGRVAKVKAVASTSSAVEKPSAPIKSKKKAKKPKSPQKNEVSQSMKDAISK